jgi:hypothetical protein
MLFYALGERNAWCRSFFGSLALALALALSLALSLSLQIGAFALAVKESSCRCSSRLCCLRFSRATIFSRP